MTVWNYMQFSWQSATFWQSAPALIFCIGFDSFQHKNTSWIDHGLYRIGSCFLLYSNFWSTISNTSFELLLQWDFPNIQQKYSFECRCCPMKSIYALNIGKAYIVIHALLASSWVLLIPYLPDVKYCKYSTTTIYFGI